MRVYEIARELELENKLAIKYLNELGVDVKSHANAISEEDADRLREKVSPKSGDQVQEVESAAPTPVVATEEIPAKTVTGEVAPPPPAATPVPAVADEPAEAPASAAPVVTISDGITVGDLAGVLGVTGPVLVRELMAKGVMAGLNQSLDTSVAIEIAAAHGMVAEIATQEEELLGDVVQGSAEDRVPRAPIVTIMGHVDHGKTHLLDSIRETNVLAREAGGITQHIGASEVDWEGNRLVFIDTPGHEAFTRMRARGAQATDIVVLVVAADDGIMPQTIEAIDHARAAEVPIIVAINKIDRAEANVDRVKQQLLEHNLQPEDWGGTVVCVPVSAKTKEGLGDLLEMIVLSTDLLELQANPKVPAQGIVLEAQLDRQRGPIGTLLIQDGTLHVGDSLIAGAVSAKVRAMVTPSGARETASGPASAVEILGFSGVPQAGDHFQVIEAAAVARKVAELRQQRQRHESLAAGTRLTLEDLHARLAEGDRVTLPVVLKCDAQGSVETLRDALTKLSGDSVEVDVIHASVGGVRESDVLLASASGGVIVGFNVRPERGVADVAVREKIELRLYTIIYQLMDDIKKAMVGKLAPTFEESALGAAEVRNSFRIPKAGTIAGCYVTDGKVTRNAKVRLVRDSRVVYEGRVGSLRRFKDDVRDVAQGYECGIGLENFNDVKIGDVIEAFEIKEIAGTL